MLEKARAVMPAKPAAPVKAGAAKGPGEASRASSGQFLTTLTQHWHCCNMELKILVCFTASRSTEDLDTKADVKKVRGGAAVKKVTRRTVLGFLCSIQCQLNISSSEGGAVLPSRLWNLFKGCKVSVPLLWD